MELPDEAELLGAASGEVRVSGAGADAFLEFSPVSQQSLIAHLDKGDHDKLRIYLALDRILGEHDATVLKVCINRPETTHSEGSRQLLAGSIALYGLSMASSQHGEGMAKVFDVTQVILGLLHAGELDSGKICVSVAPRRPLPDGVEIVISNVVLYSVPFN